MMLAFLRCLNPLTWVPKRRELISPEFRDAMDDIGYKFFDAFHQAQVTGKPQEVTGKSGSVYKVGAPEHF